MPIRSRCTPVTRREGWTRVVVLRLTFTLTLLIATAASACGDDPLGPFQPEVSNMPGSFQLQATGVSDVTSRLTYTWANSAGVADVDHSTATTGGSARLVIRADDGTEVYDADLSSSLNEQTAQGPAGDWTVEVILSDFSGTLNFRLQTP